MKTAVKINPEKIDLYKKIPDTKKNNGIWNDQIYFDNDSGMFVCPITMKRIANPLDKSIQLILSFITKARVTKNIKHK